MWLSEHKQSLAFLCFIQPCLHFCIVETNADRIETDSRKTHRLHALYVISWILWVISISASEAVEQAQLLPLLVACMCLYLRRSGVKCEEMDVLCPQCWLEYLSLDPWAGGFWFWVNLEGGIPI